jgi:hypothetical protein
MNEHDVIILKTDTDGIPRGTKGTIVFVYSNGVYEVEFMVNGKSVTETLTDEDVSLFNNIIH